MPEMQSARVAHVSLDDPFAPIEVGEAHDHVLLVVTLGGTVLGEVLVPARGALGVVELRETIARELGERIAQERLRTDFLRAARGSERPWHAPEPRVSVVVSASDRAEGLPALLASLDALDPPAHEVIVIEEPNGLSRSRNRGVAQASGDVVAFVEDDHVVDRGWLEGLGRDFDDRLVMAIRGYTGPLDSVTREQLKLERNPHGQAAKTYDRIALEVPRLPEGNCFYRREAFDRVGAFSESLGPGTPTRAGHDAELQHRLFAAGWRVGFRPWHIAWRRPGGSLFSEGVGAGASVTQTLLTQHDLSALAPSRRRLSLSRGLGRLVGPFALLRSRAQRRGIAPIAIAPQRTADSGEPTVTREAGPPLSIAVASYNRREPLANLLQVFAGQSYPADRFEVVVVVDGSTDGTAERARGLDLPYTLRVFEQENRGLAASRNRGAHEASEPVVVFIDDDMAPERDFLAAHAAVHGGASSPVASLGTCPPANPGDDVAALALRHWWEDYYRRRSEPDHQWVYTDFGDGNMSLPKSILEESGGWDEEFAKETVRRQDWELAIRLVKAGVRFVDCPEGKAWHHFEADLATSMRNRRVEGSADVLLGMKHPQVREHLFLRRYIVDEKGRERQYRLFQDHRDAGERIVKLGARSAQALEKVQMRWVAWKSMLRMLSYSYLIGVRERLPTDEEFREFVAPMLRHELAETVPVALDRQGSLEIAPAISAVDLLLTYGDRELARVEAIEPEVQWDWDTLTERVVRDALDPYREAAGELAGADPAPDLTAHG